MAKVLDELAKTPSGGRNSALNHAAWTLDRWIAAGALEQTEVQEALYAAAVANGLVADDGERQCWATIRSGLKLDCCRSTSKSRGLTHTAPYRLVAA